MANTQKQPDNTFQLSKLRDIANLDDQDLLLVSDYEPNGCFSRKMNIGRFMTELSKRIKVNPSLKEAIDAAVAEAIETPGSAVDEKIETKIEEQVSEMILKASAGDED